MPKLFSQQQKIHLGFKGILILLSLLALPVSGKPTAIKIKTSLPLPIGVDEQQQLRAFEVTDAGLERNLTAKAVWESSNPQVVTVQKNGNIKGMEPGSAIIGLTSAGKKAFLEVVVEAKPIKVFFKTHANSPPPNIWQWYLSGNADPSGKDPNGNPLEAVHPIDAGNWPGPLMQPVQNFPGWFQAELPRYDDPRAFPH